MPYQFSVESSGRMTGQPLLEHAMVPDLAAYEFDTHAPYTHDGSLVFGINPGFPYAIKHPADVRLDYDSPNGGVLNATVALQKPVDEICVYTGNVSSRLTLEGLAFGIGLRSCSGQNGLSLLGPDLKESVQPCNVNSIDERRLGVIIDGLTLAICKKLVKLSGIPE